MTVLKKNKKTLNIVIYIPFPSWVIHSQLDILLIIALKKMGHNVVLELCESFYASCPVLETYNAKEKYNECKKCQQVGRQIKHIEKTCSQDTELDTQWKINSIHNKLNIKSMNRIIDLAAQETTYTALRTGGYGLSDTNIHKYYEEVFGELQSKITGLTKIFKFKRYDLGITFNGRFSTSNMFARLCEAHNVPCLLHEKGVNHGSYSSFFTRITI